MAKIVQLIWTGDRHEEADSLNSEVPQWPVQDESARWNQREFRGQRVAYSRGDVWFGFRAKELSERAISKLNMDDLPSDVYSTWEGWYRAI